MNNQYNFKANDIILKQMSDFYGSKNRINNDFRVYFRVVLPHFTSGMVRFQ